MAPAHDMASHSAKWSSSKSAITSRARDCQCACNPSDVPSSKDVGDRRASRDHHRRIATGRYEQSVSSQPMAIWVAATVQRACCARWSPQVAHAPAWHAHKDLSPAMTRRRAPATWLRGLPRPAQLKAAVKTAQTRRSTFLGTINPAQATSSATTTADQAGTVSGVVARRPCRRTEPRSRAASTGGCKSNRDGGGDPAPAAGLWRGCGAQFGRLVRLARSALPVPFGCATASGSFRH